MTTVSYTHLDVYKRQAADKAEEKQPEQVAEQQDTAAPVDGAMNPPEAPAEEEKPRRKRKARD